MGRGVRSAVARRTGPTLTADDFTRLATAAYLLGRTNTCVQALQRSYRRHLDDAEPLGAARARFWLALVLFNSGEPAVGGGWVARGRRLLDDVAGDVVERGYLLMLLMFQHIFADELDAAAPLTVEVTEYGRRFSDPDLLANGLNAQGRMALYSGEVPRRARPARRGHGRRLHGRGVARVRGRDLLLDDRGLPGGLRLRPGGRVDRRPSPPGSRSSPTWSRSPASAPCTVARSCGSAAPWTDALEELDRAVRRYVEAGTPAPAGIALCGGRRRAPAPRRPRRRRVGVRGRDRLRVRAAARAGPAVARAGPPQRGPARRAPAPRRAARPGAPLPAAARRDRGAARPRRVLPGRRRPAASWSASRPPSVARRCGRWPARRRRSRRLDGAEIADAAGALSDVRQSLASWRVLEAPYEVARCQVLLGRALLALGDQDSAVSELTQAGRAFRELGAAPAAREVEQLLRPSRPAGLTEREVEVLRLVAGGRSNSDIAAALVLSEKTVARHLSNIFTKLDVSSRTAAAAFAFENRLL